MSSSTGSDIPLEVLTHSHKHGPVLEPGLMIKWKYQLRNRTTSVGPTCPKMTVYIEYCLVDLRIRV